MPELTDVRNWLVENPKAMTALWGLVLLVAEVGGAVASGSSAFNGP